MTKLTPMATREEMESLYSAIETQHHDGNLADVKRLKALAKRLESLSSEPSQQHADLDWFVRLQGYIRPELSEKGVKELDAIIARHKGSSEPSAPPSDSRTDTERLDWLIAAKQGPGWTFAGISREEVDRQMKEFPLDAHEKVKHVLSLIRRRVEEEK